MWAILNQWTELTLANQHERIFTPQLNGVTYKLRVALQGFNYLTRWDSNSGLKLTSWWSRALSFSHFYRCAIKVNIRTVSLTNIYLRLWDPAMVICLRRGLSSVDPSLKRPLFMSVGSMSWVRPNAPCGLQKGSRVAGHDVRTMVVTSIHYDCNSCRIRRNSTLEATRRDTLRMTHPFFGVSLLIYCVVVPPRYKWLHQRNITWQVVACLPVWSKSSCK